jgi:hypothetical protein
MTANPDRPSGPSTDWTAPDTLRKIGLALLGVAIVVNQVDRRFNKVRVSMEARRRQRRRNINPKGAGLVTAAAAFLRAASDAEAEAAARRPTPD